MKIGRVRCLNDSESCWTGPFTGKILTRKMASNNTINTELVGSIVYGLKFISRMMPENIFYVDLGKRNVLTLSKV